MLLCSSNFVGFYGPRILVNFARNKRGHSFTTKWVTQSALSIHCRNGCSTRFATCSFSHLEYYSLPKCFLEFSADVLICSLSWRADSKTISCWSLLRTQRLSRRPHRPLPRALLRYLRVTHSPWPNYWTYTDRFVNVFKLMYHSMNVLDVGNTNCHF